jgi:hypothetical protein
MALVLQTVDVALLARVPSIHALTSQALPLDTGMREAMSTPSSMKDAGLEVSLI